MSPTPIHNSPMRITDLIEIKRMGATITCSPVVEIIPVDFTHCTCQSQFNVLLGLCVGHDSLFFRYADAPGTVLAVKDRLLGHNPLAAVYEYESYYRYLKQPFE